MTKYWVMMFVLFVNAIFAAELTVLRQLSIQEYRDKMQAGWIGQMAGVGWAEPTEFKFRGTIIPEPEMPQWTPERINMFHQDDIYVEMTFLKTLADYGFDVSQRQAGEDFARSEYRLWHANVEGRNNLRRGIAPPDSGHPAFNKCADDIDYQIEADYSGLIAPGLPNVVIELGDKFGRLMNYGDGVYGGVFVGGMYAEAFFERDIQKIIAAGLACIPQESQYAEMVRDVVAWHASAPNDWEATWEKIDAKYHKNPDYRRFACDRGDFNIDAKLNGAYILMGLLYGEGDPDKTIIISTRCGQDSDCNPSSAAGILFTSLGMKNVPAKFTAKLDETTKFSYTAYNVPELLNVCEDLARKAIVRAGGKVDGDVFVIPAQKPSPGTYLPSWQPAPPTGAKFTDEERKRIKVSAGVDIHEAVEKVAPGWKAIECGADMNPGLRGDYRGKQNVLMTHPFAKDVACGLVKTISVPAGKTTTLLATVSHHQQDNQLGDWEFVARVGNKTVLRHPIGKDNVGTDGWVTVNVDLTPYTGSEIEVVLENAPTGWQWEAAYWAAIELDSK